MIDTQENHSAEDKWVILDRETDKIVFSFENWRLVEKVNSSNQMTIIRFINDRFKIKSSLRGVAWIGKHFYITEKKKKPYTFCISLSREIKMYRDQLIKLFDLKINKVGDDEKVKDSLELPNYSNVLSFVIRKYTNEKALSRRIVESGLESKFLIEGPYVSIFLRQLLGDTTPLTN
jgi:hypothetical protein